MSEFYQPGQHPDADQLSAFAENALPTHEREQTLAHLAGCADCRTIVSLALPPIEDIPQVQPASVRRPWFYGWNVAWLAGAGLAALIFLTVHMHNGTRDEKIAGETPTQTAEVHPAVPPPPATMEPAANEPLTASAAPAPARKTAPSPTLPPAATDSTEALQSPAAGTTINGQQIVNLPIQNRRFLAQPQQQQMTQQQQAQQQNGALRGSAYGAGMGSVARGNLSPYAQNNTANYSNQNTTVATAAAPAPAPPPPPVVTAQVQPAPAAAAKQTTGTVTVNAADMKLATTDTAALMTLAPGVVGIHTLPSHLAIASTITHGDQMLALDTAGTLFVSSNSGRHWKTVAAPWPGRAVRVTLASLPIPAKQPPLYLDGNASGSALSTFAIKPAQGPSLTGIITDPTGAIISGVSLRITDTRTGIVRTAITDRNGRYAVGTLVADAYQVDASAPGFEAQRRLVTLTAAQQSVVNMSLSVGAASETIEVNAESAQMDKVETRARSAAKDIPLKEPSAVFEITTDGGEIWTSVDGKSWKRK